VVVLGLAAAESMAEGWLVEFDAAVTDGSSAGEDLRGARCDVSFTIPRPADDCKH